MIFNTDDRIQFRKQFIKNPTTVRHFISRFVPPSNSCHVQPPGSGSGVLTSESSLVPEEARAQAEHMVPTSLRWVIKSILMFTVSLVSLSLLPGLFLLLWIFQVHSARSLYTLYYSVTFSDVEHWKVSSIISIGSSEMFSTLTEEVLSGICEYHQ